ncbi:MAG: AMP-binding protein [Acidobacteriota bacterium]|jgi:long-chain acyl-CoA synthetase
MARSDLLDYLQRYRDTPRRRLGRTERWRRRAWTRRSIADVAEALASRLHERGIGSRQRVGIWVKDGPLWAAAMFGVLRAGATAVPVDTSHPAELAGRLASRLDLSAWVADPELPTVDAAAPSLEMNGHAGERPPPPWPDDDPLRPAQIVLTSGTTGEPQSVTLSHANMRSVIDALDDEIHRYRWLIRLAPRLRLAVALPLSHLYGQYMGVLVPVLLGADVTLIEAMPAAEMAAAIRRERAWALATVPHTLASLQRHLLDAGREAWGAEGLADRLRRAEELPWPRRVALFDPLRRRLGRRLVGLVSGGAALDAEIERVWRLLGYIVVQGYGLTEAAPLVTLNNPFHARAGSVGAPLPGVELRLTDDGEILVRGPNVATPSGRGPRVDAEGWLHTGDFGELLDDGTVRYRGRRSDRIVTPAGVNVDPDEVAAALRTFPGVIDAIALEHPRREPGTVCAVLAVYPGTDVEAAVRSANRDLADAARVRAWFVWPHGDLPRTSTGKVRRADVLAWLAAPPAPEALPEDAGTAPAGPLPESPVEQVIGALAAAPGFPSVAAETLPERQRGDRLPDDAPVSELLSSLERVELAARLEALYGVAAGRDLFVGDPTIRTLRATLRRAGDGSADGAPQPVDAEDAGGEKPGTVSIDAAPPTAAGPVPTSGGTAAGRSPALNPAHWRFRTATRATRFVLREGLMHPLARLLLRIEVEAAVPLNQLPAPFLLAANHASFMDPAVMFALPARQRARLAPAARWNFFTERRNGARLYFLGVLFLDLFPLVQAGDWRPTLRIGGELADHGRSILIYPEGEISRDGALHRFHRGVAVMSRELHLPIVPCGTAGLERVLPPDSRRLRRATWSRPLVAACFGAPFPALRPGDDLGARVRELEDTVHSLRQRAGVLAGC